MGNLTRKPDQLLINSLTDVKFVAQYINDDVTVPKTAALYNLIISTPYGNATISAERMADITIGSNTITVNKKIGSYSTTANTAGTKQIDEVYMHPYYPVGATLTVDDVTKYNVSFKLYRKPKFNGDPLELLEIHRTYNWIGAITNNSGYITENETAATSIMKDINADVESPVYCYNKITNLNAASEGVAITTTTGTVNYVIDGTYTTATLLAAHLVSLGYIAFASTTNLYIAVQEGMSIAVITDGKDAALNKAYLYLVARTTDDQFQTIIEPKMGTVTTATAGVYELLPATQVAQTFPIAPWMFGQQPNLPIKGGAYTKIKFKQRSQAYSLTGANHLDEVYDETEIWILTSLLSATADSYIDAVYSADGTKDSWAAATVATQTVTELILTQIAKYCNQRT